MAQLSGNLFRFSLFPSSDGTRRRVDLGCAGKDRALEAAINNAAVFHVEIREKRNKEHRQQGKTADGEAQNGIAPCAFFILSIRNSDFDSHVGFGGLPLSVKSNSCHCL